MNQLTNLYRDSVFIFSIFIFGMGISQIAYKAMAQHTFFIEMLECMIACMTMAVPVTLYRIFSGSRIGLDAKTPTTTLSALLVCVLVTYIGFGFTHAAVAPVTELHF